MKRPILAVTLGFILGIIWGLYFNIVLFLFIGFGIYILKIILHNKNINVIRIINVFITKIIIALFFVSFLIGITYIKYLEKNYEHIYNSLYTVKCVGTIISEKNEKEYNYTYKIKVKQINGKNIGNKTFFLSLKKQKNQTFIKYGDKVYFEGEYIKPEKQKNYKGFNYCQYLKTLNIYGTINVNNIKVIDENNLNVILLISNKLRTQIINNINKIIPEQYKGIFLGLLLGYTNYIEDNVKENFSISSLSHLLAVSGTHIAYIILSFSLFLKILKVPKKINKFLLCIILIFYLFIIGFPASATRAVIMAIISSMQFILYRKQDIATTISFSALLILLFNPYKILDIGFLLSFFGTIGIIIFVNKIIKENETKHNRIINNFKSIFIVTISAQIMLFPILLYYFNTISFTFILSNLMVGLIIGPIIMIGLIIILISIINVSFTTIFVQMENYLLFILLKITEIISKIPLSRIYFITPKIPIIILYYIVIFSIFIIYSIRNSNRIFLKYKIEIITKKLINNIINNKFNIFIIFLIIILISNVFSRNFKYLKIYFIDVGQGDSCLIVTPNNKKILIDGGGSENYDIGKNTLFPYLLDRGIMKLDYILISHFDTDHSLGCAQIIENINVSGIILSEQYEKNDNYKRIVYLAKKKNIKLIYVKAGNVLNIDDVKLAILHPQKELMIDNPINNNSIVCKMEYNSFSILFTGDIEKEAEELILNKNINLKADILKVAHHRFKDLYYYKFFKRGISKNSINRSRKK